MNWAQFNAPVSHMLLAGSEVFLTRVVAGSNPFTVMTNIFVSDFSKFSENSIVLPLYCYQKYTHFFFRNIVNKHGLEPSEIRIYHKMM